MRSLGHPRRLLRQHRLPCPRMEVRGSGMEVWKVEGPAHQETEEPQPTGSRVLRNRSGRSSLKRAQVKAVKRSRPSKRESILIEV